MNVNNLYCPNEDCRKRLRYVKVISGDVRHYVPDSPTTSFKEDENYYPEPETDTVVLCPECDTNITAYIILKEDL